MEYAVMAAPLLLFGATNPTEMFVLPAVRVGADMVDGAARGVAVACAEFAPRPLAFEVRATK
jgi:hypothetical protein